MTNNREYQCFFLNLEKDFFIFDEPTAYYKYWYMSFL